MTKPSVLIEGVSKKFGLSLRSALKYGLIDSLRRSVGMVKDPTLRKGEFWALQDVNVALEPGDALGIMGVNGSGKTTLLRILNGTYSPDAGRVTMRGRIGALIAAGAGFSPMLSGRENVFINGALLGMTPQEIRKKFDEIVAFADLGEFIDMPVRNYSSGMTVRLGFAIAVLGQPEILLVDEVLAVGDIAFQKKCYERIFALRNEGVTIILVSHAPGAIWAVCNKGLVLHHGESTGVIGVEDACKVYDHNNYQDSMLAKKATIALAEQSIKIENMDLDIPKEYGGIVGGTGDVIVHSVTLLNSRDEKTNEIQFGEWFTVRLHIVFKKSVEDVILRLQVDSEIHKAFAIIDSYESSGQVRCMHTGDHFVDVVIKNNALRPGIYSISPSVTGKNIGVHLFYRYNMIFFTVKHSGESFLYADFRAAMHFESQFIIN